MINKSLSKSLGGLVRYCGLVFFGFFMVLVLVVLSLFSVVELLYRWILWKIVAPFYQQDVAKAVDIVGHAMAGEFLQRAYEAPRDNLVTTFVLEGILEKGAFYEVIEQRWINSKDEKTGELQYPELRLYMENWLGFIFWKKDKSFHLNNHIYFHEIEKNATSKEAKYFLDGLIEELVNQKWTRGRSPWEVHVINNYNDKDLLQKTNAETLAAIVFLCHHGMADGYSVLNLLVNGLCNIDVSASAIAEAGPLKVNSTNSGARAFLEGVENILTFPFRLCHDLGYALCPMILKKTPWHIPDNKKNWKQIYSRSPMIPIEKVKNIKNRLGVSFTGVILSSISAGAAHIFKLKGYGESCKTLPFATAIPLSGHSDQLQLHFTGTVLALISEQNLDTLGRLEKTEKNLKDQKQSLIPQIVPFWQRITSAHVAPFARLLLKNRMLAGGISNFPGPGIPVYYHGGRKVLTAHFAAGALEGDAGVGFMILSYHDHIQIAGTAETAAMNKYELEEMIRRICTEIDNLHELSLT